MLLAANGHSNYFDFFVVPDLPETENPAKGQAPGNLPALSPGEFCKKPVPAQQCVPAPVFASAAIAAGVKCYFFFAFLTAAFGFAAAFDAVAGFFAFFFATIGIVTPSSTREGAPRTLMPQHIAKIEPRAQHIVQATLMHERHAVIKHM